MLRMMTREEAGKFARLEQAERPYPWTERHFLETLTSDTTVTLVLEDQNDIVGFAVVQVVEKEAYILNMMVVQRFRRHGWGQKLLEQIFSWAMESGASNIFLDVDPRNIAALGLYSKLGFTERTRRKNAYPHGEDAIVMSRDL